VLDAVVLSDFLPQSQFERLLEQVRSVATGKRVNVPRHKRGATVSYSALRRVAPEVVEFYSSEAMLKAVSSLAGEDVLPTPTHDQSSCSILIYNQPGDHIGWHYDWNFYNGRHFTALLTFVNRHATRNALSSAELFVRSPQGQKTIPTPPNSLVLFEGALLRHCVRPLGKDETRIVLSMTFCTDANTSRLKEAFRRFKDIGYFGPRALWNPPGPETSTSAPETCN
jgi:hypothetical protein